MKQIKKQTHKKTKHKNKTKWQVVLPRFSAKKGFVMSKATISIPYLAFTLFLLVVLSVSLLFGSFFEKVFALYPDLSVIQSNALEMHVIDVGQGDAIALKLPDGKTMLVDSGPASAEEEVLFYLQNIFFADDENAKFDYVVLTHSDADHSGNMNIILNTYEVYNFFRPRIYAFEVEEDYEVSDTVVDTQTYTTLISTVYEKEQQGMQVWFCEGGLVISGANYSISFYSPNIPVYSETNEYSPIMIVQGYEQKIMLTGDASEEVEREVLNNYDWDELDVDVLKLAHHGSDTSTSYDFLQVVQPEYAVISVSATNSYGHPSEEVLENIHTYSLAEDSDLENNVLMTSKEGNVIFYANENDTITYITIENSYDFLYMDWWVFALSVAGIIVVLFVFRGIRFRKTKASN